MAYIPCNTGGGASTGYDEVVDLGTFNLSYPNSKQYDIRNLVEDVTAVSASDFIVSTTYVNVAIATAISLPYQKNYSGGLLTISFTSQLNSASGKVYLIIHH